MNPADHYQKSLNQSSTDQSLWEGLQAGSQKAYSSIYEQYVGPLYTYGKKLSRKTSLVEDAIQEVFIELWRYHAALGQVRSIKAYLFTCLRRQLLKSIKRENVLIFNDDYLKEDNFELEFSAQELLIQAQDKYAETERIKRALNQLTRRQKEIIYLKFFQELSYEEIGQMMDLSQRSTYNLVSKALSLLKDKLIFLCLLFFI
jgi:RNA polymerase sigma factor (sigma-70 family)